MLTHRALSLHPLHEVTKKHGNFGKNIFSDNRSRLSGILTGLSAAFGDPSSNKMFPQSYFKPRPSHQTFSNTKDRHDLSTKEMRIIFVLIIILLMQTFQDIWQTRFLLQVKTFETQFTNLYQEYQSSNRKARIVLTSVAKSLYLRMILFPYFRKQILFVSAKPGSLQEM